MPESGARNVFFLLLNFITLYLSAVALIMLTWGLGDSWFADPLASSSSSGTGLVRAGISMVVVAFPAFLFFSGRVRPLLETQDQRSIFLRSLIYLTLLIIALTAIGDVITVIYLLLGGELTGRFAVRGLGILLTVGLVYAYYLGDLRQPKSSSAA